MASTIFHIALLAIVLPSLVIGIQKCPFDKDECDCADSESTTEFAWGACTSITLQVPKFSGPEGTYTIHQQLDLVFSTYNIPPRAFAAFKEINFLNLSQPIGVTSQPQRWSTGAFLGPKINGMSIENLAGVIPPPLPLNEIAHNLVAFHVINCRETVTMAANKFSKFDQLQVLYIQNTPISSIDDQAFNGLQNLTELWLMNAKLKTFPGNAIKEMTKLYRIDVSGSNIQEFAKNDFVPFSELIFLVLDGNNVQAAIDSGALFNVPQSMTTFFMRYSNPPLTKIPTEVIAKTLQVTILSLVGNAITHLKKGDFPQGTEIVYLDLSENPIMDIEVGAFDNLPTVNNLYLDKNQLESFDFSTLSGMSNLYSLDMNDSPMISLNVTDIAKVPHTIQSIRARNTKLAYIDPQLDEIVGQQRFRVLDITDVNTLVCDHDVIWMAKYALCKPVRIVAPNTRCTNGRSLVDFLAASVDDPCVVTPSPGTSTTQAGTTTEGNATTTPAPIPTTTGASSLAANIVLMLGMGAGMAFVKFI